MKVVLIRHAEAAPVGEGVANDYDRPLTEHGRTQAADLAAALKTVGCLPDVTLSSPLVRAWQTADILADALTPDRDPIPCDLLASGAQRPKRLTRELADWENATAFLVGHMPDIALYAAWLLGAADDAIDFDKAAAALIEFRGSAAKGEGCLKWLVPPAWLMPAGKSS